eukprot:gene1897-biopygen9214
MIYLSACGEGQRTAASPRRRPARDRDPPRAHCAWGDRRTRATSAPIVRLPFGFVLTWQRAIGCWTLEWRVHQTDPRIPSRGHASFIPAVRLPSSVVGRRPPAGPRSLRRLLFRPHPVPVRIEAAEEPAHSFPHQLGVPLPTLLPHVAQRAASCAPPPRTKRILAMPARSRAPARSPSALIVALWSSPQSSAD